MIKSIINRSLSLEDKIKIFINKGWTYDPITGIILSNKGKQYGGNQVRAYYYVGEIRYYIAIQKYAFAWYLQTGQVIGKLYFIDGNDTNLIFSNLSDDSRYQKPQKSRRRACNDGTYKDETILVKKKIKTGPPKIKQKKFKRGSRYLDNMDLLYQIIISKGKGRLTDKATKGLQLIVDGIGSKFFFGYRNNTDKDDCAQEAMLALLENWHKFDERRYEDCFSYYTEVAKRAFTKGKTNLDDDMIGYGQKGEKIKIISIEKWT